MTKRGDWERSRRTAHLHIAMDTVSKPSVCVSFTLLKGSLQIIWMVTMIVGQSRSQPAITTYTVYIATIVKKDFVLSCGGSVISKRQEQFHIHIYIN